MGKIRVTRQFFEASGRHDHFFENEEAQGLGEPVREFSTPAYSMSL